MGVNCFPDNRIILISHIDFDRAYLDVVIAHLKALHGFDPVAKLEKELREKQK